MTLFFNKEADGMTIYHNFHNFFLVANKTKEIMQGF